MAGRSNVDQNEEIDQDEKVLYNSRPWLGVRTVVVPKVDDSLDFTFRHLAVQPRDQSDSDDSTLNGDEIDEPETVQFQTVEKGTGSSLPMETIFVKQVKQDSKAHDAGLRTGDRIVSINGVSVAGKTYAQVIRLIHGSDSALTLMVIPKDDDVLQMAYRTASGDDRGMEIPSQISSQMSSTCVVSLSPDSTRRGERRFNHEPVTFSSSPENLKGHQHRERTSSSSPSLRINVRIGTLAGRGTGGTAAEMVNPAGSSSNEKHVSGGSSFYPVTTISRKIKPEDSFSPQEHYFLETGFFSPSERRHGPLRADELRQVSANSYSSQGESGVLSGGAGGEPRQGALAYSMTPRQSEVDGGHRRFPKMTSYQEITLAKLSNAGANAPAPHGSSMTVPPRASSQEASCSSSHFIQMGAAMPPPGPLVPDSSQTLQQSGISSLVGPRHQMFASARPQSYESLFGRSQLSQNPDSNPELTGAASRSSSELVDSSFARAMQLSAAVSPNPSTTADQPRVNLVTERMKRFETVDANAAEGVRHFRALKPWVDESVAKGSCPQFGFDSVAKRAAHFEQISSEDAHRRATEPAVTQGKRSELSKTYRAGGTGEPRELWSSSPSPSPAGSKQVPQSVTIPLYFRADPSSSGMRPTSPALRRHDAAPQNYASDGTVAESLVSYDASSLEKKAATHSSDHLPSPKLPARQLSSSYQEKSERAADGSCSVTVESFSQSTTLAMAATLGIRDQLFTGDSTDSPSSSNAANVSGKSGNSNIKKFVAFFTDKTPKTVDVGTDKKSSSEPLTGSNITYEGCLVCKAAVAEGKKASDRSWKQFWAVLKGHFLCLYKDRYSTTSEDQSLCIKSCSVEIASDYIKKRNVFQVTTASGSKFLFQADDTESMSDWVKAIQSNSELKEVKETDTTALGQNLNRNLPVEKTSPQVAPKAKKQPSRTIPTSKSPASPLSKSRRSGVFDKDTVEPPRSKPHKTWKGKVVSKFGRKRSGSGPALETPDDQEVTGTFGVPLCDCPPSLFNEYVPLIVETCTKIVEERGIENQGIYRVPGNNCAVNTLRDELNKFPENIDADSEKLQDVNVVSSLLKLFFRKLPDSLVTDDLYESVIAAYRLQNPEKKMLKLKKLLHELPEHNFETFRFLAQHLNRVANREELNKMDARNLAIVFGPTLVRPQDESVALGVMVKDMSDQCRVVETIIVNVDWFFGSWDEDVNVPVAEENEPISSMNPELLAKAENRINPAEMTRDTSAKDLVSSIFHPRKRIRRKERHKNAESIETEGESDVSFTDRTVDQDLDIQGLKVMLESGIGAGTSSSLTVSSAPASATLNPLFPTDVADTQEQKEAPVGSADAEQTDTTTTGSDVEVKRYPAYQFGPAVPVAETENSKPKILRRYSEDAFGRSSARVEPGGMSLLRPFAHDGSLVENAQQQLRRLHLDTKALHHKQELERMEREKRSVAKERIEREINKTLQELESEENESPNESPKLSSDSPVAGNDSSSVRSALDRCKLALYENRLRFFTDFGEKKPSSPLFRQGGGTQSGVSSTVSPAPLTRRLSDQPGDSLRAKDDCLLRAAPVRAHSVSPSIIGWEQKYNFDERPYVNSDTIGSTGDSSSSFQRLDRSLAAVLETPLSTTNVTCVQLCASSQPLIFSPSKLSAKDFSTSSAGSLTVGYLTESSTARSSLASSGDHSAKDSVFSEKSPTESEPNLPASADSGFIPEIMTSSIQDLGIQCEGKSMQTDVIPGSHPDVTSAAEGLDIVGLQEKISLDSLSSKGAVSTASFTKESLSETGLDKFNEALYPSGVDMPSSDILKDSDVGALEETAIPADFELSEEKSAFAEVVEESCLVSLPKTNQLDHAVGSSEVDMARGDRTVVAVDSSHVICGSVGEILELSADVNLTGGREFCLHATDFTESTPVSTDVATDDILLNCSLPLKPEKSFNVKQAPTGDDDGELSEKTCKGIVSNGQEVNPSSLASREKVTFCEVTGAPVLGFSGGETDGSAAPHSSSTLLPALAKLGALPQTTSENLPSVAPAPTSCHRFTCASNFIAKKLQRRHSIDSGPLQGLQRETATRLLPGEPSFGQFESRDLSKIHPAASLPLLPNP